MPQISISSERLLEICAEARKGLEKRRRPASAFGMSMSYEMPAFHPETAERYLIGVEDAAKKAIKLGGDHRSQVVMDSQEVHALEWLLEA